MSNTTNKGFIAFVAGRLSATVGGRRSKTAVIVAVCGIALALFTVMLTFAVVAGFKNELENKIYAFNSILSIYPVDTDYIPDGDRATLESVVTGVIGHARVYESHLKPALLKSENNFDNIILVWNDDSVKRRFFEENVVEGHFVERDSTPGITVSQNTAQKLNVQTGDRLDIVVPVGKGFKLRKLTINGIYDTHFTDYDGNIAYVSPLLLKSLQAGTHDNWGEKLSVDYPFKNLEVVADDAIALQESVNAIYYNGGLEGRYAVGTITQNAGAYFAWLSLLDTNELVITLLMIFIAAFTLISSIIIIILERVPLIGLLRAQGALKSQIKMIFIRFGCRIVILAIVIADILAVGLIIVQNLTHFIPLNPDDYYLSYVPMDLSWWKIILTDACALILGIACMLLPAMIVGKVSLTKAIRFN